MPFITCAQYLNEFIDGSVSLRELQSWSVAKLGPLLDLHLLGMDVKRYVSDNVQQVGFH
jgi:hypothetical protein